PRPDEPGSDRWAHAGDVVHAAVLRHGDGRDRPWLVCLHGFGMGYTGPDLAAFRADELHRRHLLNVVVPVLPRHGPRRIRNGSALLSLDVVQSVHGLSQAVWDMRRLIGWIRATTGQPVGITGISLGGYTTALVAGLEPVDLAIAGIPAADFPDLLSRHAPPHVRRTAKRHGILGEHADAVARVVSPLAFAPRVPQPRRFIYAGMGDRLAPASHALRLWEHWEQPAIRCYPGGHVGFVWSRPVRQFVTESLAASGFATPNRG
ncbi:MAG: alpha/beta hydrolase family protein, partial [Acidimicrobiales bacterium]